MLSGASNFSENLKYILDCLLSLILDSYVLECSSSWLERGQLQESKKIKTLGTSYCNIGSIWVWKLVNSTWKSSWRLVYIDYPFSWPLQCTSLWYSVCLKASYQFAFHNFFFHRQFPPIYIPFFPVLLLLSFNSNFHFNSVQPSHNLCNQLKLK